MLTLWNPLSPARLAGNKGPIKTYVDRLFDHNFDHMFSDLMHMPSHTGIEYGKNDEGKLSIAVDVPGIKEADLDISVLDNQINVKGQRNTATSTYQINKSFSIPEGYESDNIKAELKDGVLTLTLVSKPPPNSEVKKIAVSSE